jgi:hypothetical protein
VKSREFAYWLQGFFELSEPNKTLTPEQVKTIKNHLKLVFLHEIDPSYSDNKLVQTIFQNIHDGKDPLNGLNITHKPVSTPITYDNDGQKVRC